MPNNRRRDPGGLSTEAILGLTLSITAITALVAITASLRIGRWLTGVTEPLPSDPFDVFFGVLGGTIAWSSAATAILVGILTVVVILVVLVVVVVQRRRGRGTRVDGQARYMGRGKDVESISRKAATATATRLGVTAPGVPIGRTLAGGVPLYGSWEDMHIDIWGPRTGKTTARAVPAILEAPGAVLVTSNKRDVVDATRDPRAEAGPVWVFDPQAIALEEPTWWWDPLTYVTDEVKAATLAEHFAAGSRDTGARTDAFFDPAGQDLLAGLLMAAALDRRPITDVYTWLTNPINDEPARILRKHGLDLLSAQVFGVITAPEKQRGGVYGTAQQMASCLTNRAVARWVTPHGPADLRPQFHPADFVRTGGTLYSLSKEGRGSAGPLVTALTVAVVDAAETLATHSAGGRLAVPLLGVLDEAANVCRWRDLPNLYSHYGSRGIILMTILQSWSQGADVWGEAGMKKLWSASNVKVYGGGVFEVPFLEDLSKMIGQYDVERSSATTGAGRGGRSVSRHLNRENILDVDALAALPRGRAIVFASGTRPTLIRTQPWMTSLHAERVRASIAAHDPQTQHTQPISKVDAVPATVGEWT